MPRPASLQEADFHLSRLCADQDLFLVKPGKGRSYRVEVPRTNQVHLDKAMKTHVCSGLQAVPPSQDSGATAKKWHKKGTQRSSVLT